MKDWCENKEEEVLSICPKTLNLLVEKIADMAKTLSLQVRGTMIRTMRQNGMDYICITDIARQKNSAEPKDVVKNWMRLKNTLEYLGLWEQLNNPSFKGVEFDPIMAEAGSNAFTMSPSRWVELTGAIGIRGDPATGKPNLCQRSRRAECRLVRYDGFRMA